jgi:hypothetical protein
LVELLLERRAVQTENASSRRAALAALVHDRGQERRLDLLQESISKIRRATLANELSKTLALDFARLFFLSCTTSERGTSIASRSPANLVAFALHRDRNWILH